MTRIQIALSLLNSPGSRWSNELHTSIFHILSRVESCFMLFLFVQTYILLFLLGNYENNNGHHGTGLDVTIVR